MNKIIFAAVISTGLFIIGWYSLFTIKKDSLISLPNIVVDSEPFCDDEKYLDAGFSPIPRDSDDKIPAAELELLSKPMGPEEFFLSINDGQTLHSLLRPQNVSEQEIAKLSLALQPYLRVRDLAAGDLYRIQLIRKDDSVNLIDSLIIRKVNPFRVPITYRIYRRHDNQGEFVVDVKEPVIVDELALMDITVKGTLYQSFNQIPFGTELMQRVIGIFAWQMRMPQDVMSQDQIELLVVKRYTEGEFIGFGKIERVSYKQTTRVLNATFFSSKDKTIQGFFDSDGKSVEREFAYSPVNEVTATSNQKWRLHPVRKIPMRHNGIDYRGTIGTEFFSIADGEVIEKKYDENVGNMMRILHKYGVHSEYFHADALVKNINVGDRVKRRQLLGTIGRTGRLCTGPHLHMGLYKMNGEKKQFIDLLSLKKILKNAPDIPTTHLAEFFEHQKNKLAKIDEYRNFSLTGESRGNNSLTAN